MQPALRSAAAAWLLVSATTALADGFRVVQGGPSLGNAGAGSSAAAEDPTTAFFNPAGLVRIRDAAAFQVNAIRVATRFRDDGSEIDGRRLRGGDHERFDATAVLPGQFLKQSLGDRAAIGASITSPFGLVSDYPDGWVGRYHATRSSLRTVNVAPCAALRLSDTVAVGAALDLQYLEADLENAIDFGSAFGDAGPRNGLHPQDDDGAARLRGESFAVSATLGVLWEAGASTRIGLTLHGPLRHEIAGRATYDVPYAARRARLTGRFDDTDAQTTLTLPEVASFGLVHDFSPRWQGALGVDWTNWSRFDELSVDFDHPRQRTRVESNAWQDTLRPAAGVTWRPAPDWTFRAGAAWDPTTVDDAHRRPRAPDLARFTLAAGVGWRLSDRASLDLVLLRAWSRSGSIDLFETNRGLLAGEYRSTVDYASVQLTVSF